MEKIIAEAEKENQNWGWFGLENHPLRTAEPSSSLSRNDPAMETWVDTLMRLESQCTKAIAIVQSAKEDIHALCTTLLTVDFIDDGIVIDEDDSGMKFDEVIVGGTVTNFSKLDTTSPYCKSQFVLQDDVDGGVWMEELVRDNTVTDEGVNGGIQMEELVGDKTVTLRGFMFTMKHDHPNVFNVSAVLHNKVGDWRFQQDSDSVDPFCAVKVTQQHIQRQVVAATGPVKEKSVKSILEHECKQIVRCENIVSFAYDSNSNGSISTTKTGFRMKHHCSWTLFEVIKLVAAISKDKATRPEPKPPDLSTVTWLGVMS